MPSFAVFFADQIAFGMQLVDASDAIEAEVLVMDQNPGASVHAVEGALVTEENRHLLLANWIRGSGALD